MAVLHRTRIGRLRWILSSPYKPPSLRLIKITTGDRSLTHDSGRTAWIITAGKAERDKQAVTLAKKMGCEIVMKNVLPAPAIKWLFPVFQKRLLDHRQSTFAGMSSPGTLPWFLFSPLRHTLSPPLPSVVISTCADTTLAALQTKASSNGVTQSVCIGMPYVGLDNFDVAVMGRWEWPTLGLSKELKGSEKVIPLQYCLNTADEDVRRVGAESQRWAPEGFVEGKMTVAVLIGGGGDTREFPWRSEDVTKLTKMLERIVDIHDGQVLLRFTEGTTESVRAIITSWHGRQSPTRAKSVFISDELDKNNPIPYNTILAKATHIAVTADSIPMVSEALSLRKPLYIIALSSVSSNSKKQFYSRLIDEHRARRFVPSRTPSLGEPTTDILSDVGEHPDWDLTFTNKSADVARQVERVLWG
ncbi:mitochondrial fission ELM1-domain-containing protein [Powellomyces hirtus]|nr:mitochondrial fission ELM1-domain-containing protein [Powellomyces hirtus]